MKTFIYQGISILILSLALSSCIETIDPDLGEFEPKVVIEGLVTDIGAPQIVKLSRLRSFYSEDPPEFIENATVILSDNIGNKDTLTHQGFGRYTTDQIPGIPGNVYEMEVLVDGESYKAVSEMRTVTTIDSVYATYYDKEDFIHEIGYYISFISTEPQDTEDFYLWKFYRNGNLQNDYNDINVASDEGIQESIDGIEGPYSYEFGDTARIEMYSLTKDAYNFYETLNNNLNNDGGFFSTPPSNPPSNISNGALGLFQVSSIELAEKIIK